MPSQHEGGEERQDSAALFIETSASERVSASLCLFFQSLIAHCRSTINARLKMGRKQNIKTNVMMSVVTMRGLV